MAQMLQPNTSMWVSWRLKELKIMNTHLIALDQLESQQKEMKHWYANFNQARKLLHVSTEIAKRYPETTNKRATT